jgi:two-component system, NtrC family, response regulator
VAHRLLLKLQRDDPGILSLVGSSVEMRELARQVDLLSSTTATALLLGESGSGKGRLAEYIHARSDRAGCPFVEVSCATSDTAGLTAELFGRGESSEAIGPAGPSRAASPASPASPAAGLLAAVQGGTIFMDEISALPDTVQLRLLAVLEGEAPGDGAGESMRPRVIAAATRDLVSEVNAGRFNEALYYRLSVTPVHLPPLRARSREDIVELINATFNSLSMSLPDSPRALGAGVVDCMVAYPWPGNLRELCNALERAILTARGELVLHRMHLPVELRELEELGASHTARTLMEMERAHIHRALHAHNLNRTHAARELGISRATLIKKIRDYGLAHTAPTSPPSPAAPAGPM